MRTHGALVYYRILTAAIITGLILTFVATRYLSHADYLVTLAASAAVGAIVGLALQLARILLRPLRHKNDDQK